jgi:hypothetical protein
VPKRPSRHQRGRLTPLCPSDGTLVRKDRDETPGLGIRSRRGCCCFRDHGCASRRDHRRACPVSPITVAAVWASHTLSHRYPGPMPHHLRWGLLFPRGFHSPGRLRRILQPHSGERILELGPGIGAHALPMAGSLAPRGTLDVLDIQQSMLNHLIRRP